MGQEGQATMTLPEIAREDFQKYREKRKELDDLLRFEDPKDDELILAFAISDALSRITERIEVYKRITKSREERMI